MSALEKKNKDGIPHLYKSYISLLLRSKMSMVWRSIKKEDGYKEIYIKNK